MGLLKTLFIVLILITCVTFTVVNAQIITLSFYPFPYEIDMPLYILMLILLALGAILGNILTYGKRISLYNNLRKKEKQLRKLEEEIEQAKSRAPESAQIGYSHAK